MKFGTWRERLLCRLGLHDWAIWHLDGLGNRHCRRCWTKKGGTEEMSDV